MTRPIYDICPICDAEFAYYGMHLECAQKYLLHTYSKCPSLVDVLIDHIAHMATDDERLMDTDTDEDIGEENN